MPVYNEADIIVSSLQRMQDEVPVPKRVFIVYDHPDDTTVPVVESVQSLYPWAELTRNEYGRGVINAVRWGFSVARSDVVIVTMADQSDDLRAIPQMVSLIREQGFDIVCASRYMEGGLQIGGPWLKGQLSRLAGLSLRWLTGLPSHDATNAFRAYRREILEKFPIESRGGFEYSLEITVKAFAAGHRVTEVPSVWHDRSTGESKFQLAKWLPHYLRWYLWAIVHRPKRIVR